MLGRDHRTIKRFVENSQKGRKKFEENHTWSNREPIILQHCYIPDLQPTQVPRSMKLGIKGDCYKSDHKAKVDHYMKRNVLVRFYTLLQFF